MKSKASAVRVAINEYIKRKNIENIQSMKGKLEFSMTSDEIRHHERQDFNRYFRLDRLS